MQENKLKQLSGAQKKNIYFAQVPRSPRYDDGDSTIEEGLKLINKQIAL